MPSIYIGIESTWFLCLVIRMSRLHWYQKSEKLQIIAKIFLYESFAK